MNSSLTSPLTVYSKSPFAKYVPVSTMHSLFDEVFGEFQDRFLSPFEYGFRAEEKYPPMNISEDSENWYIELAVAGHSKDTLSVEYKEGCITVRGKSANQSKDEKTKFHISRIKMSSFQQIIHVAEPTAIEEEKIKSTSLNGVLTITLPKKQRELNTGNARKINIG